MYTLRQYLMTLSDPAGLTRTLGEVEVCRDPAGRMCFSVGNSAVVFRIRHRGRIRSLRGYLRPQRHLREIYGDRLLEKELYLYTSSGSGVWVDVVLGDWIEGISLHEAIARAAMDRDRQQLECLAGNFDRLAASLVADDCAHGDLKPENILVAEDGTLHPIDLDATYLPSFAGQSSPELGTAAYQHPARTAEDFNERLDDYPAALISTALHALSVDPTLWERYGSPDSLLYDPHRIATDKALRETLERFEALGMALPYRIAQLLLAPRPELPDLAPLLDAAVRQQANRHAAETGPGTEIETRMEAKTGQTKTLKAPTADNTGNTPYPDGIQPELFVERGRWGFRTPQQIVVPPLYDNGFDFSEGLAAVQLGHTWHFIDLEGRTRLNCPGCDAVKPFRRGRARIRRNGHWSEIDPAGHEFDI